MRVELNFGRRELAVDLDEHLSLALIRKPVMPRLAAPAAAVAAALAAPVAASPLTAEAAGKRSACILICDITRPVPNGLLLPPIIRALLAAGLPADAITVLVATGLHRPNLGAELEELVGDPWVLNAVRVENHYARDDAAHVAIGRTRSGTLVKLDRRFVEAELRIVTGLVEPHFMAGYSGGRKVIAPGVAHADTITTFHNHRFMSHPAADNCVLAGNPLHREQVEIVQMLGRVLAINTVIDEARNLSFVNFGEVLASHEQAVDFVRGYVTVPVGERFHTVLTSAAGYPLDKTYYQTVKGMVAPLDIVVPGGELIIASECSEGIGSEEYRAAQRRLIDAGTDGFERAIAAQAQAEIDEWQTQMQLKPMRHARVSLYCPGLGDADFALTGVARADSIAAAVSASVLRSGSNRVAVIPEGPYLVPVYQAAA